MTAGKLFLLFLIYAFIGWLIEVIAKKIELGKFINRGFLIGPYLPIYGCGGVLITLALTKYSDSPITLFVMALFICSVLEYATSYILEKLFNARWWDYSGKKFNVNGRICLNTMAAFGALGCVVVYILNPLIFKMFSFWNNDIINVVSVIFGVIIIFDIFVSFKIMSNIKLATMQFKYKDNTEEITKKVKELLYNKSFLTKRLIDSFSGFTVVIDGIKNELEKTKKELKKAQKELKKVAKLARKKDIKIEKLNKKNKRLK